MDLLLDLMTRGELDDMTSSDKYHAACCDGSQGPNGIKGSMLFFPFMHWNFKG